MTLLQSILSHNEKFVADKQYNQYATTKFPNKKLVILTCMDTRLLQLLPHAMNVKNGDAKIIKNAGAVISHPFGSIMRSILIALYELHAEEVMVVGHHGCGMSGLQADRILNKAKKRGVDMHVIEQLTFAGISIEDFLTGFNSVEKSIINSTNMIKNHPLLPENIPVHGLLMCPETGEITVIVNGYA